MNQWLSYSTISKMDLMERKIACNKCYKEYDSFKVFDKVKDDNGNILSDSLMVCRRMNNSSFDELEKMDYIYFDSELGYHVFKT